VFESKKIDKTSIDVICMSLTQQFFISQIKFMISIYHIHNCFK